MAILWITVIGFIICLGLVGGVFIYFLRGALPSDDSKRIDPIKTENDDYHP